MFTMPLFFGLKYNYLFEIHPPINKFAASYDEAVSSFDAAKLQPDFGADKDFVPNNGTIDYGTILAKYFAAIFLYL